MRKYTYEIELVDTGFKVTRMVRSNGKRLIDPNVRPIVVTNHEFYIADVASLFEAACELDNIRKAGY